MKTRRASHTNSLIAGPAELGRLKYSWLREGSHLVANESWWALLVHDYLYRSTCWQKQEGLTYFQHLPYLSQELDWAGSTSGSRCQYPWLKRLTMSSRGMQTWHRSSKAFWDKKLHYTFQIALLHPEKRFKMLLHIFVFPKLRYLK